MVMMLLIFVRMILIFLLIVMMPIMLLLLVMMTMMLVMLVMMLFMLLLIFLFLTVMHRVFQHDLYKLRLNTARLYVRALETSSNPVTISQNEPLKLSAQVIDNYTKYNSCFH